MVHPLTCRAAGRLMYEEAAWKEGSPERERLEAHTSTCPHCAAAWHELRTINAWIERFPVPQPDDRYWEYRAAAITARARQGPRRTVLIPPWASWVSAAAVILGGALLLFAAGFQAGQQQATWKAASGPSPAAPLVREKIVPVQVPIVTVRTERVVETKVVTRWRVREVPAASPHPLRSKGKIAAGPEMPPSAAAVRQPSSVPAEPSQVESPLPQVERSEFREYIVRSLPEPALLPAAERKAPWRLDTVVEEAAPPEWAGALVAPVRLAEVQDWSRR